MRSLNPVVSLTLGLGIVIGGCGKAPRTEARKVLYYHDPMHPSYRSDWTGLAPDCQMELTPVYADEADDGPAVVRVNSAQASAIALRTEAVREDSGSEEV